jgi:hypothetical protein
MEVKCTACRKTFHSVGAHVQSFKDLTLYVCLICTQKQKAKNAQLEMEGPS